MCKEPKTIFQSARLATNYTQEVAAEILLVSIESIRAYERGVTVPPDDVVVRMVETYEAPWLAYQYLKQYNEVGQMYLPDIEFRDMPMSVLFFQKELNDVVGKSKDMITAACTGTKAILDDVKTEVREMISAGLSLMFAPVSATKTVIKEKASVLAHRR